MIRAGYLMMLGLSTMRLCGRREVGAPPSTAVPAASAEGAAVAVSGGLSTEVVPQSDGRLVVHVRDARQMPLEGATVQLAIRRPDGQVQPVAATYDPALRAYVARPAGLVAGSYPVEVTVQPTASAPPVQLRTPPVRVSATVAAPSPRYGGRVEVVGNHAVEMVSTPRGDVAMYWMDINGTPVPPAEVQMPSLHVRAGGRPRVVPVQVEGGVLVAHAGVPLGPGVTVGVPSVRVRSVPYVGVVVPHPVIVAALPTVVVAAPAPTVVVAPPVPSVVVGWHGHGHGHGHGHFRGGVIIAPGGFHVRGRGRWK